MDKQLYGSYLSTCNVFNGSINFSKQISKDDLMNLYLQLSNDLLGMNIPHWRIFAFYHGWDDLHGDTCFRTNDLFGMSLIELGQQMQRIIPISIGGNDPTVGCYYGEQEEVERTKNTHYFDDEFGIAINDTTYERRANILKLTTKEIGSLMSGPMLPPEADSNDCLKDGTIWYTQFKYITEPKWPEYLVPDFYICTFGDKVLRHQPHLIMLIKRGTGKMDYAESQALLKEGTSNIMPCRVAYDLSNVFTIRYPSLGDTSLKLVYHEKVNEHGLSVILNEYGEDLVKG